MKYSLPFFVFATFCLASCSSDAPGVDSGVGKNDVKVTTDSTTGNDSQNKDTEPVENDAQTADSTVDTKAADASLVVETWVGNPCSESAPCQEGFCLDHIGEGLSPWVFPGGYCTQECEAAGPDTCPPGSRCDDFAYGGYPPIPDYFICTKRCDNSADCREAEDYICQIGTCIYF